MDLDIDLSAIVNFLQHCGPAIQGIVLVSLGCWYGLNRLIARSDKKEKDRAREEENHAKDKRAKEFRDLLTNVTLEMKTTAATSVEVVKHVTEKLDGLQDSVQELGVTMKDLRDRQAQVISKPASLAIVEGKFDLVRAEIIALFDYSLRKNNFIERADYIKTRMTLALGQIINRAEESLHVDYPGLDVDLHPWFECRGGGGATRYVLVDECWDRCEVQYDHKNPIDERVEEMRTTITTVLTDHIQKCRATVTDIYANEDKLSTQINGN